MGVAMLVGLPLPYLPLHMRQSNRVTGRANRMRLLAGRGSAQARGRRTDG